MNLLHVMLSKGFGGLEKVFVDYQPHLEALAAANGGVCIPVVRHGAAITRALTAGSKVAEMPAWTSWDPVTIAAARALVRRHRPSAIICHGKRAFRIFKRACPDDVALVAWAHNPRFEVERRRTFYVCVAEHLAEAARSRGIPEERIFVLHNAVAQPKHFATPFSRAGSIPTILTAGRLHPVKGYDNLLEALALLKQQGLKFTAVIAGEGEERGRLEAQIQRLGLSGDVSLPGWVDDVPSYLARGDLFVFPSRREGFPLMLLEAMASGLPVIASAIPATEETVIDGETGRAAPVDDPQALAETIRSVLSDPAEAAAMGQRASAHVLSTYGEERLGPRLADILAKVTARPV